MGNTKCGLQKSSRVRRTSIACDSDYQGRYPLLLDRGVTTCEAFYYLYSSKTTVVGVLKPEVDGKDLQTAGRPLCNC